MYENLPASLRYMRCTARPLQLAIAEVVSVVWDHVSHEAKVIIIHSLFYTFFGTSAMLAYNMLYGLFLHSFETPLIWTISIGWWYLIIDWSIIEIFL